MNASNKFVKTDKEYSLTPTDIMILLWFFSIILFKN